MITQTIGVNINPQVKHIFYGMIGSGVTGEILHDKEITGNSNIDLIIKIVVPIVTGCLIPSVNKLVDSYIKRKNRK